MTTYTQFLFNKTTESVLFDLLLEHVSVNCIETMITEFETFGATCPLAFEFSHRFRFPVDLSVRFLQFLAGWRHAYTMNPTLG